MEKVGNTSRATEEPAPDSHHPSGHGGKADAPKPARTVSVFRAGPGGDRTGGVFPDGFSGVLALAGLESFTDQETGEALAQINHLISWACAQQARLMHRMQEIFEQSTREASGISDPGMAFSLAASECATILNLPQITGQRLLFEADRLCTTHTTTLTALDDGTLSYAHAQIVIDQCLDIPAGQVPGFEADLLAAAPGQTRAQFAVRARRLREKTYPDSVPARHRSAFDKRKVTLDREQDGMSCLSAYLQAAEAQQIYTVLSAAARGERDHGDPRTTDQLRADILAQLLMGSHHTPQTAETGSSGTSRTSRGTGGTAATGSSGGGMSSGGTGIGSGGGGVMGSRGGGIGPGECSVHGTTPGNGKPGKSTGPDPTGPVPEAAAMGFGTPAPDAAHPTTDPFVDPDAAKPATDPFVDPDAAIATGLAPAGPDETAGPDPADPDETAGPDPADPDTPGMVPRAEIMVLIHAETLFGANNDPAELHGYGPITAEAARTLARNARHWTGLVQDPRTGEILAVGRRRKVPAGLARWLRARDATCRFPGCRTSTATAEIDHTTDWAAGGGTDHGNLAHLCRRHHRYKTLGYWKATQPSPGVIEWTSPTGRTYRTEPFLRLAPRAGHDPRKDYPPEPEPEPQPPEQQHPVPINNTPPPF